MNPAWPVPIPLLSDELLSSWLARAALAQGCEPLVLTGALWPDWRAWTRDIDRGLSEERLLALANVTGIEPCGFQATSLRPAALAITLGLLDDFAIWPWMLALGTRNRKRRGGLQYCPSCLKSDKKPYYRRQWRQAWHVCCPVHGLRLLDQCPQCSAPVEPHRLSAEDRHLAICATCKYDLRDAGSMAFEMEALAFQEAADNVVLTGQGHFGTGKLSAADWFQLSRYFLMLLRKVALSRPSNLTAFANHLCVDTDSLRSPATGLPLELLPVEERVGFLAGTWKMLDAGPGNFLTAATDALLTKASFRIQRQPVPAVIASLIADLPEKGFCRTLKGSIETYRPRSPQSVKRMLATLQRKMRTMGR